MELIINRRNSKELASRRDELSQELIDAYTSAEGLPITRQDLRDLASMGCLSDTERNLYDELRRIEMMLDIDV